jgi:hypothetical protein
MPIVVATLLVAPGNQNINEIRINEKT